MIWNSRLLCVYLIVKDAIMMLRYLPDAKQFVYYAPAVSVSWEQTRLDILATGEKHIPAGTVMVFMMGGTKYLMFQTLTEFEVTGDVSGTTLIPYEAGSIVYLRTTAYYPAGVPTLRLRDCRMPTYREYLHYNRSESI